MWFISGYNHPNFALPRRTLLAHLVTLHLLCLGSAQLNVVAPSHPVTATVGQDVVLRCHLSPCKDARSSDIRWIQNQFTDVVHHYRDGEDVYGEQLEEYKGRTELLRDGLSDGNLDLRITGLRSSDGGSYFCIVQDADGTAEAVVDLAVSDPYSHIIHPLIAALAMVLTISVVFLVLNVHVYRKKVAQTRELGESFQHLPAAKSL
ncbi:MOG protein, partial [Penelope pileata]|nr:MOG protein [Penelope pileata]